MRTSMETITIRVMVERIHDVNCGHEFDDAHDNNQSYFEDAFADYIKEFDVHCNGELVQRIHDVVVVENVK